MEDKIMQRAIEIVERYHLSGNKLPRLLIVRDTPQREQEFKDAQKLKNWKKYLNNMKGGNILPEEVKQFLDEEMIGWRDSRLVEDSQDAPMEKALVIENRYRARGFILPREHIRDDDMSQNTRDASRLRHWRRSAEVGKAADGVPEALMYLDTRVPGWRGTISSVNGSDFSRQRAKNNVEMDAEAMFKAILQEKVAGGGADEMDRETFCRWFVRYRGEAHRRLRSAGVDADNCRAATSSMSSSLVTLANPIVRTRVESIETGSNKSRNGGGRVRKTGKSVRKNSTIVANSNCNGKRKAIDGEKSGAIHKKGR